MTFETKNIRVYAYQMDSLAKTLADHMNDGWKTVGGPVVTESVNGQWVSIMLYRQVGVDPSTIVPRVY